MQNPADFYTFEAATNDALIDPEREQIALHEIAVAPLPDFREAAIDSIGC